MSSKAVISIGSDEAVAQAPTIRRMLYLVLLLAIRDRATEVQFERSESEGKWKLGYRVNNQFVEMVPVPSHFPVSREIMRLAGMGLISRGMANLHRLLLSVSGRISHWNGRIRLLVMGQPVEVAVTVPHRQRNWQVSPEFLLLRLPSEPLPSEEARQIIHEHWKKWKSTRGGAIQT